MKMPILKPLLGTALMLLGGSIPTHALAGWNGAEWGMTPQQVESATSGFARMIRSELPQEGADLRVANQGEFSNEVSDFRVRYYFSSEGLAQIELVPQFSDCQQVFSQFVAAFGAPETQEQVILRIHRWYDEENDNLIGLIHSTSRVCEVNFSSLERYRDRQADPARNQ